MRRRFLWGLASAIALAGSTLTAVTATAAPATPPISWGSQVGTAEVHNLVWVDAPRVPDGWTTTYAWNIGGTYTSFGHHYYDFAWATEGKTASVKVLVRSATGQGYTKYYNYGTVGPPVLVSVHVQLLRAGGPPSAPPPSGIAGAVKAISSDGTPTIASARTNSTGHATLRIAPGVYQFAGEPGSTGNWGCMSYRNIHVYAGSHASVQVLCAVP